MSPSAPAEETRDVDLAALAALAPPAVEDGDDKEGRGQVLVVGGSCETPGAAILAGLAALRVGAGKLQIATAASVATAVAVAVPEALVVALPETADGYVAASAVDRISERAQGARAVVIGPGLLGPGEVEAIVEGVLPQLAEATVVIDAAALVPLGSRPELVRPVAGRAVVTPNGTEAGMLLGQDGGDAEATQARRLAVRLGVTAAVRGWVADPADDGPVLHVRTGGPGLGTSGSGDVLAGAVAGLAARGSSPTAAAVWGVHLHGAAGDRLARGAASVGYLARELLDELHRALDELEGRLGQAPR